MRIIDHRPATEINFLLENIKKYNFSKEQVVDFSFLKRILYHVYILNNNYRSNNKTKAAEPKFTSKNLFFELNDTEFDKTNKDHVNHLTKIEEYLDMLSNRYDSCYGDKKRFIIKTKNKEGITFYKFNGRKGSNYSRLSYSLPSFFKFYSTNKSIQQNDYRQLNSIIVAYIAIASEGTTFNNEQILNLFGITKYEFDKCCKYIGIKPCMTGTPCSYTEKISYELKDETFQKYVKYGKAKTPKQQRYFNFLHSKGKAVPAKIVKVKQKFNIVRGKQFLPISIQTASEFIKNLEDNNILVKNENFWFMMLAIRSMFYYNKQRVYPDWFTGNGWIGNELYKLNDFNSKNISKISKFLSRGEINENIFNLSKEEFYHIVKNSNRDNSIMCYRTETDKRQISDSKRFSFMRVGLYHSPKISEKKCAQIEHNRILFKKSSDDLDSQKSSFAQRQIEDSKHLHHRESSIVFDSDAIRSICLSKDFSEFCSKTKALYKTQSHFYGTMSIWSILKAHILLVLRNENVCETEFRNLLIRQLESITTSEHVVKSPIFNENWQVYKTQSYESAMSHYEAEELKLKRLYNSNKNCISAEEFVMHLSLFQQRIKEIENDSYSVILHLMKSSKKNYDVIVKETMEYIYETTLGMLTLNYHQSNKIKELMTVTHSKIMELFNSKKFNYEEEIRRQEYIQDVQERIKQNKESSCINTSGTKSLCSEELKSEQNTIKLETDYFTDMTILEFLKSSFFNDEYDIMAKLNRWLQSVNKEDKRYALESFKYSMTNYMNNYIKTSENSFAETKIDSLWNIGLSYRNDEFNHNIILIKYLMSKWHRNTITGLCKESKIELKDTENKIDDRSWLNFFNENN